MKLSYSVHKEVTIDAAHHIPNHPKCGAVHGHSYRIAVDISLNDIPAAAPRLSSYFPTSDGMLFDYGEITALIKQYDHTDLNLFFDIPSSERIAQHIAELLLDLFKKRLDATVGSIFIQVIVSETPSSFASVELKEELG